MVKSTKKKRPADQELQVRAQCPNCSCVHTVQMTLSELEALQRTHRRVSEPYPMLCQLHA